MRELLEREKNSHMGDRSVEPAWTGVTGRSLAFKIVRGHIAGSFGKSTRHIGLLEVAKNFHMGVYGREFGSGQPSRTRRRSHFVHIYPRTNVRLV